MSNNDKKDSFLDSFVFGKLASHYDPIGDRMGQEWRERMGLDNKTRFEVDPTKPDGLGEKLWDKGMAGILLLILLPFILLFQFFAGPFRKDLRWPRLTRLMFALSLGGFYCLNTSPAFDRIEKKIGKLLTLPLEMSYLFFLVVGTLAVPVYLVTVFFRRKDLPVTDRTDKPS